MPLRKSDHRALYNTERRCAMHLQSKLDLSLLKLSNSGIKERRYTQCEYCHYFGHHTIQQQL